MTFVRFAGCNLMCSYCDTVYAREGGYDATLAEILKHCLAKPWRRVELTGGEPTLQSDLPELCRDLLSAGFEVLIETNGTTPLAPLPSGVIKIMDIKTPGSGYSGGLPSKNVDLLGPGDEVKFVITSRADYEWARDAVLKLDLPGICGVLFSPASPGLKPAELAEWILRDGLDVRFNPHVHRYIWVGDLRGR
jgi:7-carboxy-7-deazaguanine synthase